MLRIEHPDHDARCVSGGRAARCSQGVPIEECHVHTPFGDDMSTVAVAFEPAGPSSTLPAWSNSGESVHMRRPSTSKLLLADFCVACDHCRDCSGPSLDFFRAPSRRKSP